MRFLLITNVFPNRLQPTRGTFNLEMARALQAGHEIEVVSPISWMEERAIKRHTDAGDFFSKRRDVLQGVTTFYPRYYYTPKLLRTSYGWFMWKSVAPTLVPLMREHPPDAILAYWAHPDGLVAVRAAHGIGRPCVIMVGGSDVLLLSKDRGRRRCIVAALEAADAVVAVSQDIKARLGELGLDPGKTHVVYRGVDTARFAAGDRGEARRRVGLPSGTPLALWVGRMAPVKGLDVLMDACSLLAARGTDFALALVGDGPLERNLRAQCAERGLGKNVFFTGAALHKHLPDWYRAADITVLPSRSEGVPNVLLESIACGTPFVASRVGGIPEIATPGIDRLVKPDDPTELADAIEQQLARDCKNAHRCFRPQTCQAAAERLLDIVRPLTGRSPKLRASSPRESRTGRLRATTSPWSWRQVTRRIVAAGLPKELLLVNGPKAQRLVWLTFDDGPHPEYTPRVLDVLRANNVRATFFVVGKEVEKYPELLGKITEDGHSVGHHTYTHLPFEELTNAQLLAGVRRTRELICRLTGKSPPLFRPPHGRLRISAVARLWAAGQTIVLWNCDPKDYNLASPVALVEWLREHPFEAGDIVLLHDNRPWAAEALPEAIKQARERGLEFATLEHPAIYRRASLLSPSQ
jgi:peptidoglycan/xylan/chitin deacetylase (PgdA/CDA1 family)/glycosyltransferase involved in cell wall biosynthesis